MTSIRKRRATIYRIHLVGLARRNVAAREDQMWDQMPAVGREFGSPDFERLMEEDYRLGRGAFDQEARLLFGAGGGRPADVAPPEDSLSEPGIPL